MLVYDFGSETRIDIRPGRMLKLGSQYVYFVLDGWYFLIFY